MRGSAHRGRPDRHGFPRDTAIIRAALPTWAALGLAFYAYSYVLTQSANWLPALGQLGAWLRHPIIHGPWPHLPAWPQAVLGATGLLALGGLVQLAIFPSSMLQYSPLRFLAYALLLGFGVAGWVVQLFAMLGVLTLPDVLVLLISAGSTAAVFARRAQGSIFLALRQIFIARPYRPKSTWMGFVRAGSITTLIAIFVFALFHAVALPITEWDAVIYHAGTARMWFMSLPAPPVIAGPSVGLEMSYHYPSLFPATGVLFYLLTRGANDVYLRLLAPVFAAVCLVLVFSLAARLRGRLSGYVAVVLLGTSPLFFIYAVFPTSYAPLMAMIVALFDALIAAWQTRRFAYLVVAGVFAGLVGNLSYLSALLYAFLLLCVPLLLTRRIRLRALILPAVLLGVIAAPVYIRNWIVLGDPIFPFGTPVFHSQFIPDPSVLRDSLDEIRQNALRYWVGHEAAGLWRAQLHTLLWDKTLLPVGTLAALAGVFSVPSSIRRPTMALLAWPLFLGSTQLLAGWFWLRTLTLSLPILAVLAAVPIAKATQRYAPTPKRLRGSVVLAGGRLAVVLLLGAVVIFPGLPLAWAGPNQETWTPFLSPRADYARAWASSGNEFGWLRTVYTGDFEAWRWLDTRLKPGQRVASIENRWYYFEQYDTLLPLDGREGAPLLRLSAPEDMVRYLRDHRVRYVLAPAWAEIGPTRHPLVKRLPLYRSLGSPQFPLVAAYEVDGADVYTRIYAVGPSLVAPSIQTRRGLLDGAVTRIPAGSEEARIIARLPVTGIYRLRMDYLDNGDGPIDLNYLDVTGSSSWRSFTVLTRHATGTWISRSFVLVGFRDLFVLGPYPRQVDAVIRRLTISPFGADERLRPEDVLVLGSRASFTVPLNPNFDPVSGRLTVLVPGGMPVARLRAYAGGAPISLEVWSGFVTETTAWWKVRIGLARAPALPKWGVSAPSLRWDPTPGTYTVMIVSWNSGGSPPQAVLQVESMSASGSVR